MARHARRNNNGGQQPNGPRNNNINNSNNARAPVPDAEFVSQPTSGTYNNNIPRAPIPGSNARGQPDISTHNNSINTRAPVPGAEFVAQPASGTLSGGTRYDNKHRAPIPGANARGQPTPAAHHNGNTQGAAPHVNTTAELASTGHANKAFAWLNEQQGAWLSTPVTPTMAPSIPTPPMTPAASPVPVPVTTSNVFRNMVRNMGQVLTPPTTPPRGNGALKLPWELGISYPAPRKYGGGSLKFEWDHSWVSHRGKGDAISEWTKEVIAYRDLTLPLPTRDMSQGRLAQIEAEYAHIEKSSMFNVRKRNMQAGVRFRPTLVFTSHLPSLANERTWSPSNRAVDQAKILANRACPNIFNILRCPDVGTKVTQNLLPSLRDLSSFGQTCKIASNMVRSYHDVWDFHSRGFPVGDFETIREEKEVYGEKRAVITQGGGVRSHILLITGAGNDIKKTETPYADSLDAMIDLMAAIRKAPKSFRYLTLHQIPFLDTRMLRIMINSMPNLETISISSCLLLDASRLPAIIQIIRENPRKDIDKDGKEVERFIRVDFSPYRFFGPQSTDRYGSYLITHHKPNFDIPKAVTAFLLKCLPGADYIGMDLLSDSSSFWHFVRQLPGPCPLWAAKVRETLMRMRINNRNEKKGTPAEYDGKIILDNLCAAVSGDYRAPGKLPARRALGFKSGPRLPNLYWRQYWSCTQCKNKLPASLFVHAMPKGGAICWACSYQDFAHEIEHSHFRRRKLIILDHLFDGFPIDKATVHIILITNRKLQAERGKREDRNESGNTKTQTRKYNGKMVKLNKREKMATSVYRNPRLNYQAAYGLAMLTDLAWAYYKNPGVVKNGELVHYWELDAGDHSGPSHSGAMYRFLRLLNPPTGPSDYLQGGPQYAHPCFYDLPSSRAKYRQFKVCKKNFARAWMPRRQHFKGLKDMHADEIRRGIYGKADFSAWLAHKDDKTWRKRHAKAIEDEPTTETDYHEWLAANTPTTPMTTLNLSEYWKPIIVEDHRIQNNWDWNCWFTQRHRHEDTLWSLTASNQVIYNLDTNQLDQDMTNNGWNIGRYDSGKW